MTALARWCFGHRLTVVASWVGLLAVLGVLTGAVGSDYKDAFKLPNTDSSRATALLQKALPEASGDSDQIVVHVDAGSVRDSDVKATISTMLDEVSNLTSVASVTSPYTQQGASQISEDGSTAYATVLFDAQAEELATEDVQKVLDTAQSVADDGLQVELGGQAIQRLSMGATSYTELVGVTAAAIILFVAFGSLLGMLTPILIAIAGLGAGLLTSGLLSHLTTLGDIAPTIAALIGLGVGIDYALFIVTRYRTGLQAGLQPREATVRALDTSGRAVLFAGATVIVALLGLLVLGVSFLAGMAIGASVTVLFTVLAAVTLLPAVLGFFKFRLLSKKQRRALAEDGPQRSAMSRGWTRWAAWVAGHKGRASVVALLIIAVLSIPTLSLRLGSSDAGNHPADTTTRKAYDLLASAFGAGFNGPLTIAADLPGANDEQALNRLVSELRNTPGVAAVSSTPIEAGAKTAVLTVNATTSPQSEETPKLIDTIREEVIPQAEAGSTMQAYVGGSTATFKDFAAVLEDKLLLFLGVIMLLGCLLLMIAFRSIVVALTAAAMNVLATAASFGVVVAVFQWGWGSELIGAGAAGPVEAFLPVIMLSILFGLSMDYQVFLVSRMREEWEHTRDNRRSVTVGQASTGRVITAAALIMICVFSSFMFGGERVIAEFGLGLAVAVLIDAFVLRTVLVPALMHVFGNWNWWLPGWLDRILPRVAVEGDSSVVAARRGAGEVRLPAEQAT